MSSLSRLRRDTRGANFVEYLVLVAMAAILVIAGIRAYGGRVDAKVRKQAACIEQMGCSPGESQHPTRRMVVAAAPAATAAATGAQVVAMSATVATMDGKTLPIGPTVPPSAPQSSVIGDFFTGAVLGDFAEDTGWSGVGGQVVAGLIPVVGQIGDVRDTIAALKSVAQREPGAGWRLAGAVVAWVPGVGDLIKGIFRGGREVATKGAGNAAKEAAEAAAKKGPVITYEEANAIAIKVYQESSGLQEISKVMRNPIATHADVEKLTAGLTEGAKRKYGLDIRFVSNDVEIPGMTKFSPGFGGGNPGTWDEAGNTIWLREELKQDPARLLREIRHEYGAYLLGRELGGKDKIPWMSFTTNADGTPGKASTQGLTHVLDGLGDSGGVP